MCVSTNRSPSNAIRRNARYVCLATEATQYCRESLAKARCSLDISSHGANGKQSLCCVLLPCCCVLLPCCCQPLSVTTAPSTAISQFTFHALLYSVCALKRPQIAVLKKEAADWLESSIPAVTSLKTTTVVSPY